MAIAKQKITPFLWFDEEAEEAVNFYLSVFKNGQIETMTRYGPEGPGPEGSVMTIAFKLDGVPFVALNGGPNFKFTEAVSFVVNCETQAEVDYFWGKLVEGGGSHIQCGWLKDRYGLAWQIVPAVFWTLISDRDPGRVQRVMHAMMHMGKMDIENLEQAANAATTS